MSEMRSTSPQRLKPESFPVSFGTAGSRALPEPAGHDLFIHASRALPNLLKESQ
jgi:hypothetical protein